jgi:predicted outer membrane protein
MMKKSFVLAACILPLLVGDAAGQANIVPDPSPRLPPQPGQGLPLEDLRFIERGMEQSAIQIEMGELAAEEASDEAFSQLGRQVAADHEQIRQKLTELAQRRGVAVAERAPNEAWRSAIDQLQRQSGEDFDQAFLDMQLKIGQQLVELYQTQASNSTDTGLASFAITTLVQLQQHFATAQQLGAQHGLSPETVEQPPQY